MKMVPFFGLMAGFVLVLTLASSAQQKAPSLRLFAAASLSDIMAELADSFTARSGVAVKLNPGSSGTLARQIELGAPADVFVSASEQWMRYVDTTGLVQKKTITRVASNALVLIAPRQSSIRIKTIDSSVALLPLLGSGRLSMGDPAHVPAGSYAREALEHFGWYGALQPAMAAAKDVRSALMVVEMGEAPLGIVFKTDALKSQKVRIVAPFPTASHKPIVYLAAAVAGSGTGGRFISFLKEAVADSLWVKHGFIVTGN